RAHALDLARRRVDPGDIGALVAGAAGDVLTQPEATLSRLRELEVGRPVVRIEERVRGREDADDAGAELGEDRAVPDADGPRGRLRGLADPSVRRIVLPREGLPVAVEREVVDVRDLLLLEAEGGFDVQEGAPAVDVDAELAGEGS